MPQGWVDRCIYIPFSGGTGSFVTSAAVEGYLTPSQAGAVDQTSYHYVAQILDPSTNLPTEWEVGTGVYTAATQTLTRVTIEFNSDGSTTPHSFSAQPTIMLTILAGDVGLDVGVTPVNNGVVNNIFFDNAGVLGEYTDAQVTAVMLPFTAGAQGVVPASGGGVANFLRADGTFSPQTVTGARVSSQYTTATTVLANIPGLSINVATALTYTFDGTLFTQSSTTGGVQVALGGSATSTSIIYEGTTTDGTTIVTRTRVSNLGSTVGAATAVTGARIDIVGTLTVVNGGTLTIEFAQQASNSTTASTILVGSRFLAYNLS